MAAPSRRPHRGRNFHSTTSTAGNIAPRPALAGAALLLAAALLVLGWGGAAAAAGAAAAVATPAAASAPQRASGPHLGAVAAPHPAHPSSSEPSQRPHSPLTAPLQSILDVLHALKHIWADDYSATEGVPLPLPGMEWGLGPADAPSSLDSQKQSHYKQPLQQEQQQRPPFVAWPYGNAFDSEFVLQHATFNTHPQPSSPAATHAVAGAVGQQRGEQLQQQSVVEEDAAIADSDELAFLNLELQRHGQEMHAPWAGAGAVRALTATPPSSSPPKRGPPSAKVPEPKPVNLWIPGIVSVRTDERTGQVTTRVGPAGMIAKVQAPLEAPARGPSAAAAAAAAGAAASAAASTGGAKDGGGGADPSGSRSTGGGGGHGDGDVSSGGSGDGDVSPFGWRAGGASAESGDAPTDANTALAQQGHPTRGAAGGGNPVSVSVGPRGMIYRQESDGGAAGRTSLDVLGGLAAAVESDGHGSSSVNAGPMGAFYRGSTDKESGHTQVDVLRGAITKVDSSPDRADVSVGPGGLVYRGSSVSRGADGEAAAVDSVSK